MGGPEKRARSKAQVNRREALRPQPCVPISEAWHLIGGVQLLVCTVKAERPGSESSDLRHCLTSLMVVALCGRQAVKHRHLDRSVEHTVQISALLRAAGAEM